MTQQKILELAKQGDAQAIATLMNHQFQSKGILVKANNQERCLQIIFEAIEVPQQQKFANYAFTAVTKLNSLFIKKLIIFMKDRKLSEIEIRRLYIEDYQWERTSGSWKELKPKRNFNEFKIDDETENDLYLRIKNNGYSIYLDVISQWIFPHYFNVHTVNNYGWINYRTSIFQEVYLDISDINGLSIISDYEDYVYRRSNFKVFEDFNCLPEDLEYWKAIGTWRIPPVILDVKSYPAIPSYADIKGTLQLIEGHTRLGLFKAMYKAGKLNNSSQHKAYLLTSTNADSSP